MLKKLRIIASKQKIHLLKMHSSKQSNLYHIWTQLNVLKVILYYVYTKLFILIVECFTFYYKLKLK